MSWTLAATRVSTADVGDELRAARDRGLEASSFDAWAPEVEAQQELCIQLAERTAEAGAVRGQLLNVTIYGHAHDGSEHSAADSLTVTVCSSPSP